MQATDKIEIFWFRQDLRLSDNPGLSEALQNGRVMPIYILDDDCAGEFKMGAASRWWLHHSLTALNESLNNQLNVYSGNSKEILLNLIQTNNIHAVYWNRCYEPYRIKQDSDIKATLKSMNIECHSFNGSLIFEPWEIIKNDGTPYKVYTPFYNKAYLNGATPRVPLPKPKKMDFIKDTHHQTTINNLNLLPTIPWDSKMKTLWKIGEKAAQKRLAEFLKKELLGYKESRDYPSKPNLSRLSPHLHFGEISPIQIWHSAQTNGHLNGFENDLTHFLRELAWREFSYYLLFHFPDLPRANFQKKFDRFAWESNSDFLKAWQRGQTGYPIVDAGMRELWQTGYMHNRVRMIVGSFLVKNLLLHWHHGENWFWDCLLDADLASNSASWQWVAGSGADAAPYFRIFNPITQGEKFDADGHYTRRFVPELAHLPNKYLFCPWDAPTNILQSAGVILGQTYPKPIIDLKGSREKALRVYSAISKELPL